VGHMRFEARELHPYAEPLTASELREGVTDFLVNFVDEKGLPLFDNRSQCRVRVRYVPSG